MFIFSNGYYALCQGPSHQRRLKVYKIGSLLLCILWFVLSIVGSGNIDGWAKLGMLNSCNLKFSIFLGVLQNVTYYLVIGLNIFCVFKVSKVSLDELTV